MPEAAPQPIELHLRCKVRPENADAFKAFLREAIPQYEKPGGIKITLWQDQADPTRFIEKVQYAGQFAYVEDQRRIETDPQLQSLLARWRALLEGPPVIEVYRSTPVQFPQVSPQPTLTTKRLTLRPLTPDDAPAVAAYCADKRVAATTLTIPHPYTLDDARAFLATIPESYANGSFIIWGIVLRDTNELIGSLGIAINKLHDKGELGYAIGVDHWNKGYTSEAALAARDCAFTHLNLNRLDSHHFAGNDASGRIMQKIGLRYEGTLRAVVKKWGVYQDSVCYALTRADWEVMSKELPSDPETPAMDAPRTP